MINTGTNISAAQDVLQQKLVEELVDEIRNPRPELANRIRQMQTVRTMNEKQYTLLKRQLPYFVCAMFNPSVRRTENFAYTQYFVVDLDHISSQNQTVGGMKESLKKDPCVLFCYTSPSGDGLKVLFRLKDRCYDAGEYKVFYRAFVNELAKRYGLEQVIDGKTCDVTRACFVGADTEAYYNPDAEPIDLKHYVDVESAVQLALDLKHEQDEEEKLAPRPKEESVCNGEPTKDVMDEIRRKLNPNARAPKQKATVYVPQELNDIMGALQDYVEDKGVTLQEVTDINYGKQLRFRLGQKQSVLNLFFGKHGFKVVITPKTGTDPELSNLMVEVVESFIVENL